MVSNKVFHSVALWLKYACLTFCFLFIDNHVVVAQTKGLRVNMGVQFHAQGTSSGYNQPNGVVGFHVMPQWRSKRFMLGLNIERLDIASYTVTLDVKRRSRFHSFSPTLHYYFTQLKTIRPFIGLSTGIYYADDVPLKPKIGFKPIAGVSIKFFDISLEYNQLFSEVKHAFIPNYPNAYFIIKGSLSIGVATFNEKITKK